MTRDIATARRVPAGVRTGGQFAVDARGEADVDLLDPTQETAEGAHPDMVDMPPEQLAVQALMAARHHARTRGLRFSDPADIAQSTVVTILEARRKNPDQVVTPAYVHRIASGHVAIQLRGNLRVEDRKAKAIYDKKIKELEEATGRKTSSAERRAIAAEIRDTWEDQRHKPSAKFVELAEMRVLSLDAPTGENGDKTFGDDIAEDIRHAHDEADVIDPASIAGQVLASAEGQHYRRDEDGNAAVVQEAKKKAAAKDRLWDAFAETSGVPPVAHGSMTAKARRDASTEMASGGGVLAACRAWDHGEETPAVKALFAPFGRISMTERDEVTELLGRHRAYAEDLWEAACRAAGKPAAAA
ncbi:hypothetical protein [Cellulosimicrobium sp. Marseille-Q4280]|uniref:hypothetical protein n=1 Tax=Cellulosimicrobium sp. Marseille-Q4280 TaxID=2937992 RepID=UPI00203E9E52|nr:hypothetical protein [Cellulosimicrobium sp. Marseille-Q4280]